MNLRPAMVVSDERVRLYTKALRHRERRRDPKAWDRVNLVRARGAALNKERRKR